MSLVAGNLTTAVGSAGGVSGQSVVANVSYSSATATVTADAPAAAGLSLTSNVSGLANNAMNTAMITAGVVDQAGDAYTPAAKIYYAELTLTGPGSFSATSLVTSDVVPLDPTDAGRYTVPVYTALNGSGAVTVSAAPVSGDPLTAASPVSISLYEAGVPAKLAISSSTGVSANGLTYTTYTVQVEDAAGNVISTGGGSGINGSSLAVSANSGNLELSRGASPTATATSSALASIPITNGVGQFTVENTTYQSSPATLTVTDTNATIASAAVRYTYMVGAPGYATVTPSSSSVQSINVLRGQHEVIQAQLTDVNGNPVAEAGQPIWFTLGPESGELALPNGAATAGDTYEGFTNAAGVATITATVPQTAPLDVAGDGQPLDVSGRLGAIANNTAVSPGYYPVDPSNYTTTLSTTLAGGRVAAGTTLPTATVVGLNSLGAPVGSYGFDFIDVTSSNPSVLSVGGGAQAQVVLNATGTATVPGITAEATGTATITFTDASEPNAQPVSVTYTVVPGSATVFPLIEQGGHVLSGTNLVSVPASGLADVQVVNVDAGGNPVPVTGTASAVIALPALPSGLAWETTDGGPAAQSGATAAIPVGSTSASVWLVSTGTAETYGGSDEAAFGVNFAGTSASADQFGAAGTSSGYVDLGAVVNPAVFQDWQSPFASASATDVTTKTALVWNSNATLSYAPTSSVWAQFYFSNIAVAPSDTFTYQLGINLDNPQYGYGTFLMPTLTGQG